MRKTIGYLRRGAVHVDETLCIYVAILGITILESVTFLFVTLFFVLPASIVFLLTLSSLPDVRQ